MNVQTLSKVTLETIQNYRNAATLAVDAYRAGSHRLIKAVNGGLEKNVYSRTGKVAPQLTNTLMQVRSGFTDIIVKGIDGASMRTEKAIEVGSDAASKGVTQVAEFAAGIDNRVVANGIEAAARLSLPGAKAALAVSAKVAEGVDALSRATGGGRKVKPARVVKKAKKTAVVRKIASTKAVVKRKLAVPRKAAVVAKAPVARARRKVAEAPAAA